MFDRLGRLVLNLRFLFVIGWAVAALAMGLLGPSLSSVGSADETSFLPANAESLAARKVISQAFPGDAAPSTALLVFEREGGLTDADRAVIEGLRSYFEGTGRPASIKRYVTAEKTPSLASMFRSSDGAVELARVDLSTPSFLPATNEAIDQMRAHLAEAGVVPAGLNVYISGQAGIGRDYLKAIEDGTNRTTIVTIVLVVAVLMLIYRAPLAALVPLITIGCAFLVSRGILGFMAQGGWRLSSVLDSFIVVLAFGVGTDYSIFLISRFREELARNQYADAVRVTVGRIGAVISASAATVIVGLGSMFVASFGMIQTTGPALGIVIFVTLLAGLTLTPSLLAIFGRRLFWPLHERTHVEGDDEKGVWANLARGIVARPGLLAIVVGVMLAAPLLALPGLRQNFDVLQELPTGAESRTGFDTLSAHLPEGQLMPLNVVIEAPGTDLSSPASLAVLGALVERMAATPGVQTVSSVVDPAGEGKVSDLLRLTVQLDAIADGFAKPPSTDLNKSLSDASLAAVQSTVSYVEGIARAYPAAAGAALDALNADLAIVLAGITDGRQQANLANQLAKIQATLQAAASGSVSGDAAAALTALKAYLDDLGAKVPAVTAASATNGYASAQEAVVRLASGIDLPTSAKLLASIGTLQAWAAAQSPAIYFSSSTVTPTAAQIAAQQALVAARGRLPAEALAVAAAFGPNDLYASPELVKAYVSEAHDVARIYVTTTANPYDTRAFETVRALRTLTTAEAADFGQGAKAYVGGSSAEFTDVQTTIESDFNRVAIITIVGILIVLILLLRAIVAPVYLVLTVLLSYMASLSLSAFLLENFFGQSGVNYFIPLMVFVLLVALGSDYNIFLMSRVREESEGRPLRAGIRIASARTGTVITSAGLILAGTFGALITSPLQLLFQVGVTVALGVLIDTFVVRSLLVPAVTAFVGERAWWPGHRKHTVE
jgi:putative drug exporter of the RND superfamily